LAALDFSDGGGVHTGAFGQLLLGQMLGFALGHQDGRESLSNLLFERQLIWAGLKTAPWDFGASH
jgi:hypothetical protein